MKNNRNIAFLSTLFALAILTAIYFQFALVKSRYNEEFTTIENHLLDLFDDSFYHYREAVIPKDDSISLKNLEIDISSLILKNSDYPEYIEGDLKETIDYLPSVIITPINLSDEEFNIILDTLAKKASKENLKVNYSIELHRYSEEINYPELHRKKDVIMAYSPGVVSFNFENELLYILSKIKYMVLSAFVVVIAIILSSLLLTKRYLKERKITKYKNDFINNLTHELQTPITISNLALERLAKDVSKDQKLIRYIDIAQVENAKIGNLVKRILSLAEMENIVVEQNKIDVCSTIKIIADRHKAIITDEDTITTKLNCKNFTLKANEDQFIDLLDNLISNAIKYSNSPRKIYIKTNVKGNNLKLSVEDNGVGIPSEFTEKIFSPFFKIPNDNNIHEIKSHGLGLSYVAKIVEYMKGTITVTSERNKGTIFTIIIPNED